MALIKVEIKLGEVKKALTAFKSNRVAALEALSQEVRDAAQFTIEQLLQAEIDLFLGQPDEADNKKNGKLPPRNYVLKGIGGINVRLPRDRMGRFESSVIPRHEKMDPRLEADMAVLQLAGLSTRTLSMLSKRVLGVEAGKDTISSKLELIHDEARNWLTRNLDQKYWALYVDGTNFKIQRRGSTRAEPSLVVLGVDSDNYRSILAIEPGSKDSAECWRAVFKELKKRGLDAESVRLGVMDGLPGLERVFKEEFANSKTQRCWVHSKRNAVAKAPARLREEFSKSVDKVMYASSEDDAQVAFKDLRFQMGRDAERAVNCLEKDLESLLTFFSFNKRCWTALRTTNAIETINRQFKRRTKGMDTMGEKTLESVLAFTALKIEFGWSRHRINSGIYNRTMKGEVVNQLEEAVATLTVVN